MHSSLARENGIISPVATFASKIGTTNQYINFLRGAKEYILKIFQIQVK